MDATPALRGTPKQIQWAQKIRAEIGPGLDAAMREWVLPRIRAPKWRHEDDHLYYAEFPRDQFGRHLQPEEVMSLGTEDEIREIRSAVFERIAALSPEGIERLRARVLDTYSALSADASFWIDYRQNHPHALAISLALALIERELPMTWRTRVYLPYLDIPGPEAA